MQEIVARALWGSGDLARESVGGWRGWVCVPDLFRVAGGDVVKGKGGWVGKEVLVEG